MQGSTPVIALVIASMFTLGLGALLSAGEAALGSITRAAAEDLVEEGRRGAERVLDLANRWREVLATVAIVRLMVDMLAAILLTLAVAGLVEDWWQVLLVAIVLNLVLIGLVVGISPRSVGRGTPEATLLALGGLLHSVDRLAVPWRRFSERNGHRSRMTDAEAREEVTQDLREMIHDLGEPDSLEDEDREMLRSVVELGQTLVKELMVPRTDMITIESTKTAASAMRLFVLSGFSRIPVVGESTDDIRGVLYLKDVLRRLNSHPEHEQLPVSSFVREAAFVPETKLADDLLREMQTGHFHMAIAVDEYGGIAGIVTLEDLLEEVVGELTDEHDREWAEAKDLGDGVFQVSVRLPIDELGELFDLEIEDDDVDTAGGLLTKAIGRVPLPGASGDIQGVHLEAQEASGRRRQVATLLASRVVEQKVTEAKHD